MGDKSKTNQASGQQPFFHIALQEGFNRDEVYIEHNGKRIYQKSDVTTDVRIGLAESFEVPQQSGSNTFKFTLPEKDVEQSITLPYSGTVYIGVSYINNELKLSVSDQPFGYL